MASVKIKNLNKIYKNNVQAVFDFNLDIEDKEFIVLVGPSGCGKSTTLRMIAGLEDISSGRVYIDDTLVNYIESKDRNIAMVFQSYALYPNMTVYDNIAFGLKMRKVAVPVLDEDGNEIYIYDEKKIKSLEKQINELVNQELTPEQKISVDEQVANLTKTKEYYQNNKVLKVKYRHLNKYEIDEKVKEAASILKIESYLARKPKALSGGQRQRVAIGRAIVKQPKIFLMDEPLSNLDAKLRLQMRQEIVRIHKELNATTIYVTHDQTEAMSMASRIVVMCAGYVQQVGTPTDIYDHPANKFVASFIGTPSINFINTMYQDGKVNIFGVDYTLPKHQQDHLVNYEGKEIIIGIRPESIIFEGDNLPFSGNISFVELVGAEKLIHFSSEDKEYIAKSKNTLSINDDSVRSFTIDVNAIHAFDIDTELTIF